MEYSVIGLTCQPYTRQLSRIDQLVALAAPSLRQLSLTRAVLKTGKNLDDEDNLNLFGLYSYLKNLEKKPVSGVMSYVPMGLALGLVM